MFLLKTLQVVAFVSQIALFVFAGSSCDLNDVELVVASVVLVSALFVLATIEKIISCLCSVCAFTETYRNVTFLLTSTLTFLLSFYVAKQCDEKVVLILVAYIVAALSTIAVLSKRSETSV